MAADGGPVRDHRPGSFLLAGPLTTVGARGARSVVTDPDPDELAARVAKHLREGDTPIAVGALPFDPTAPAHLVIPTAVTRSGSVHPYRADAAPFPPSAPRITRVPEPAGYEAAVAEAVAELRSDSALRKVVLARAVDLDFPAPVDLAPLLGGLAAANPRGYTFAAPLPGGSTLFGASPELLLAREGRRVRSNPLAGSLPRGVDAESDRANAAALLASAKDQAEHRVVVEGVAEALRPFCRALTVPAEPSLVRTSTMWHLSTEIEGDLADPEVSSLRLAAALHPTPAVCGTPVPAARAAIARLEPFDRGFYSGVVGWCDAAGDGEWVIALRCAEADGARLRLFAGAGIMPASDPAAELAETSAKFRTLLQAIGVEL